MTEQYLYVTRNRINEFTVFIIPLLGQWNIASYTHRMDKCCLQNSLTAAVGDPTITAVPRRLTKLRFIEELPV